MTTTTAPPPHTAAETFEQRRRSPLQRVQHVLHRRPELSPALVLLAAVVVFGLVNERFLQPQNLSLVLQQVAVVAALAVGQTLIILTAGIDLSVGAIMILSTVVVGHVVSERGFPGWLALLVGLLVGTAAGFLNGMLVTRINLPPFIVTLGTLNIFTALSLLISGGLSIDGDVLGPLLTFTGQTFPIGPFRVTTGVLLVLALYLVVGFALRQTAWGRHVYAVGDDADASRLAGIRVNRVLLSVYTVAGLIFALTTWVLIGRIGGASPNAGVEANLDSITAVVIGGTSLFGGRGSLIGTLLGAITVGVFRNGLALAGVDVLYQTLVVGVLVIAAVSIDQWIRKVKA
ncbi:ABC transporter permease [Quadrisphaera sp. DSM 44207]|uniref:ABC transporter permease n=1 Tax=Quadrisphaera sp. DSM 44207 TaxID=1881057 RepID=UPI000886E9A2|nr:ABC transporter permease [Quadrisphaera sp. DSM 44207]SDQ64072.1 fructose transport system permease protein [Quadrisphaera sp. DSM 44207]